MNTIIQWVNNWDGRNPHKTFKYYANLNGKCISTKYAKPTNWNLFWRLWFEEDYLMPQRRSTKSFSPPIATKQSINIPLLIIKSPTCCCEVSQGVVVADNRLLLAVTRTHGEAAHPLEAVDEALSVPEAGGHRGQRVRGAGGGQGGHG